MTKAELKPCPFCLETVIFLKIDVDNMDRHYIECGNCGIEVSFFDCLQSAIDIWNRRPNDKETQKTP